MFVLKMDFQIRPIGEFDFKSINWFKANKNVFYVHNDSKICCFRTDGKYRFLI